MKKTLIFAVSCAAFAAFAGVPIKWSVETSRAEERVIDVYHGESLDMEVTFKTYGQILELPTNEVAATFWQTNGMNTAYWRTNNVEIIASNGVMRTTFGPEQDVGAKTLRGFIGIPGQIYRAAFVLRFKDAPGYNVSIVEWPYRLLDFNTIEVVNPPYYLKGEIDEQVDEVKEEIAASTNKVAEELRKEITVTSVNGKTGDVQLVASDVGAVSQFNSVLYTPSLVEPEMAKPTMFGNITVGGMFETTVNFASNATLLFNSWDQLKVGTQKLETFVEGLSGKPTNLWNGASTKYMNVDGEIYAYTNSVYYTNLINPIEILNLYPSGVNTWQTSDAATYGEARIHWESGVWSCYYKFGDEWVEVSTKDGDLDDNIVAFTGVTAAFGRQEVQAWNKTGQVAYVSDLEGYVPTTRKVNGQALTQDITIEGMTDSALVLTNGAVKTKGGEAVTASNIGAYSATSGATLEGNVSTIGSQLNTIGSTLKAEDAKFEITNYNSVVHLPEASFSVKVQNESTGSNEWIVAWQEMTRWKKFTGVGFDWATWPGFYAWSTNLDERISNKSEREYAFYDGVTGNPAPDGFFWISQPRVAICAGMAYQRYADAQGEVWVLESNGMVAEVNGTTNGFFRITDSENEVQFEIIKGNKRTLAAAPRTMSSQVMGVTHWFTSYATTNAVSNPVARFRRDLQSGDWVDETEASCPCNTSWTDKGGGIYECEWWPKSTEPQMFMSAVYETGGSTRIVQHAPVEMQKIIIGGVEYTIGTATISGQTVLTLTP